VAFSPHEMYLFSIFGQHFIFTATFAFGQSFAEHFDYLSKFYIFGQNLDV